MRECRELFLFFFFEKIMYYLYIFLLLLLTAVNFHLTAILNSKLSWVMDHGSWIHFGRPNSKIQHERRKRLYFLHLDFLNFQIIIIIIIIIITIYAFLLFPKQLKTIFSYSLKVVLYLTLFLKIVLERKDQIML